MSGAASQWLVDTLLWTGILIAIVLIIRRPVSRVLGARAAYALWALPFLRLILPPITLPAAFAPAEAPVSQIAAATTASAVTASDGFVERATAAPVPIPFDWSGVVFAAWLAAALAFLVWRVVQYRQMRAMLLADAVPVGEQSNIRFVETPEVSAPVAFGLRDRVIALPPRFMHMDDRKARDLAIAHEIAHHRSGDILANFAAQLLLAAHWFNPVAWIGWRAMRRDQEAACDARVMAGRPAAERAEYGQVIASFAAGPHLALAAPMACPVLGEKSIIHRLRSLNMNNTSRRRTIMSRIMLGGAALALPLTASISYAEEPALVAPPAAPNSPEAPATPLAMVAPVPLAAPLPPEAPEMVQGADVEVDVDEDGTERRVTTRVIESDDGTRREIRNVTVINRSASLSDEEREDIRADMREAMADVDVALAEAREARAHAMVELKAAGVHASKIKVTCGKETAHIKPDPDGDAVFMMCDKDVKLHIIAGLKEAREDVMAEDSIDKEVRKEILRTLDKKIKELSAKG